MPEKNDVNKMTLIPTPHVDLNAGIPKPFVCKVAKSG